jgi:hypothetical protein
VAELGHKTEDQAKKNNASFDIFITMQVKRKYEALALINMKNIMPALCHEGASWAIALKAWA